MAYLLDSLELPVYHLIEELMVELFCFFPNLDLKGQ